MVEFFRRRSSDFVDDLTNSFWQEGKCRLTLMRVGINERRFATRALACGERVRYPTIFPKSLIRYLMTGDGTDAASESNGNLFTLPSREEENDKVVNRGKLEPVEAPGGPP